MSGKLDQSLEEILSTRHKSSRGRKSSQGRRGRKPAKATGTAASAPVGGVKKSVKPAKSATKGVPTGPSAPAKESKIIVTGLPPDVNKGQIEEYFTQSVGVVKKVLLSYNQSGQIDVATIIFSKKDSAAKAASEHNGLLVDGKPMKVEVVLDASSAPLPLPAKSLGERVAANPKAQPKSAAATKATANGGVKKAAKKTKKRGKNASRSKPKTADELDAELTDYWTTNNGGTITVADTNATMNGKTEPVATGGEDLGMDEIS